MPIWTLVIALLFSPPSSPTSPRPTEALQAYVLAAEAEWIPPPRGRDAEYQQIAKAIAEATDDPEDAIQLASIASFESRFAVNALGRQGERGPWQIKQFPGAPVPKSLVRQARMALERWKIGRCLYTGEMHTAPSCPLADHRYLRAFDYSAQHPFLR